MSFIKAIHHCGLVVRDLDRSIYFYHDVLGLPFANEPTGWMSGAGAGSRGRRARGDAAPGRAVGGRAHA